MMRSAYRAPMKYYFDSDETHNVDWYFVPSTNPPMPFASAFTSAIYDREELPPPPIGEQFAPVPWLGGRPPYAVSTGGICGTQAQWQEGCSITDPIPADYPNTSIPICCSPPPQNPQGGIAIGGNATVTTPPNLCSDLPIYHVPMILSGEYVGGGSPGCVPWWGQAPNYELPVTYAIVPEWQGQVNVLTSGPNFCGNFAVLVNCSLAGPFSLNQQIFDSGTCDPSWMGCIPRGTIQEIQLSPFEAVFFNTSGSGAGWQWTLTEMSSTSLYVTTCCIRGFAALRTLTVSGGGLSGSFTTMPAYNRNGWQWNGQGVTGCGTGSFQLFVFCNLIGTSASWFLEVESGTCLHNDFLLQSANCDLPSIVFHSPSLGVTVTLT